MYYCTVCVGEESVQGSAGSPGSESLMRLESKCWPGLQSTQGSTGGGFVSKAIYLIVGSLQFPIRLIGLKGLSFSLVVGQWPPSVPCYIVLSIGQFKMWWLASSEQASNKNRREQDRNHSLL